MSPTYENLMVNQAIKALKEGKQQTFDFGTHSIEVKNKTIFFTGDYEKEEVAHYVSYKNKHHVIGNADKWILPTILGCACTMVSYECIRRLTNLKNTKQVIKYLLSGKIKVIDTTPDMYRDIKPVRRMSNATLVCRLDTDPDFAKKHRPGPGYSVTERTTGDRLWIWHKPGNCLFKFENKYFICGQDEGTYFGCELASSAKTVENAIKLLAPKELRTKLTGIQRQGEWFFEPVELPKNVRWTIGNVEFHLPVEKGGNRHTVTAQDMAIDDKGNVYLRRFNVEHNEHATLSSKDNKWYRILKNTAVRSVSVTGVD